MTSKSSTRLQDVLDEQFRSKAGLARAMGVTRQMVQQWAARERPVPAQRRKQIALLLGVPEEELFEGNGDGPSA